MEAFTLRYRHNTDSHRGLATSGIFIIKFLLILPHMIVVSALQQLAWILAYFGYWIVAITGEMPQAMHRLLEITLGTNSRPATAQPLLGLSGRETGNEAG